MNRSAGRRPMLDPESTQLLNPAASPMLDGDARARSRSGRCTVSMAVFGHMGCL